MRHQLIIAYNDRTEVVRMFDETADHFAVFAGKEAVEFWNKIQNKLTNNENYPVTNRELSEQKPGSCSETDGNRDQAQTQNLSER